MSLYDSPLFTDLYQLTMAQAYLDAGMEGEAVFEFFVRAVPPGRNFLVAAGLDTVLDYLEGFHFTEPELEWLAGCDRLAPRLAERLRGLRFTGDVHAMAEGTPFFANEPILRVTAPIVQAQLVESRIINLLQFQVLVASKAARCVLVAPGKLLVDFGMRRAHAGEAGLLAARAAYLAGFGGSATVLAGRLYGVPLFGTMAHSYVQAHASEEAAFLAFARSHRDNVTLLIDTYDTERAAQKIVQMAPQLAAEGIHVRAVRLDSGDLAEHARRVRAILDAGGLQEVKVFASGNLDEWKLARLAGAPIEGFGVGTAMDVSADAPFLDCAYKLTEYRGEPRRKRSEHKATWPGRKQVYRRFGDDGRMAGDVITTAGDAQSGEPLIRQVMAGGRRVEPRQTLAAARETMARELQRLPEALRRLEDAERPYPVEVSEALHALARRADLAAG